MSPDEDVRTDTSPNQCPECNGRITTNAVETVCEDCGLVVEEYRIDHGPEWRAHDDQTADTLRPLFDAVLDVDDDGTQALSVE